MTCKANEGGYCTEHGVALFYNGTTCAKARFDELEDIIKRMAGAADGHAAGEISIGRMRDLIDRAYHEAFVGREKFDERGRPKPLEPCSNCGGTGTLQAARGAARIKFACPTCDATGKVSVVA